MQNIKRLDHGVEITANKQTETYDEVILACHSNQALQLLSDCTNSERAILGSLKYRDNEVILHTDQSLLPNTRSAWASWNFWQGADPDTPPAVTYDMNILQGIESEHTFCVTLNRTADINPEKILRRFNYAHPVFGQDTLKAQKRRTDICGHNHTHFCGAYWYNGFHEDGLRSALDVCHRFGVRL